MVGVQFLIFLLNQILYLDNLTQTDVLHIFECLNLELSCVLMDLVVVLDAGRTQWFHTDHAIVAERISVIQTNQLPIHFIYEFNLKQTYRIAIGAPIEVARCRKEQDG